MNRFFQVSLVFLLIAQSSIPFFFGDEYLIIGFCLSFFYFLKKEQTFDIYIIFYLILFTFLFLIHFAGTNIIAVNLLAAYLIRILFAYFIVKAIGYKFSDYIINIIYVLAIISFFFYVSLALFPGLQNLIHTLYYDIFQPLEIYGKNFRKNIIIYTPEYWLNWIPPRNAGPFWEPGGFACFLTIAILLNFYKTKNMFDKKNIIFFIAIITTFSTAGYILLALILILYFIYKRNFRSISIALPALGLILFFGYNKLPFLQEKITAQYIYFELHSDDYSQRGRFASTYYDVQDIISYPIAGKGRADREAYERDVNGFTSLLKQFGLLGGLTFFGFVYLSFKRKAVLQNLRNEWALYSLIIVIANGLSQSIFGKPFFVSLAFMFLYISTKNKRLSRNDHKITASF